MVELFSTLQELTSFCQQRKIQIVDFMMVDLNGRWRHLAMPLERLTDETLRSGIGFDGSNYGFAPVEKSDMVFVPDITTAYVDSFAEVPTLAMIGDVYVIELPHNRRFDQDPRNVAHHAEAYMRSTGIADEFRIGPEFEFHVFDNVSYSTLGHEMKYRVDCCQAGWHSGDSGENLGFYMQPGAGYHAVPPRDRMSGFRSRVTMRMEEQGIKVKYHHHEVGGSGQNEIEVEFGGLLEMADKTMMTKHIIRNMAFAEGKSATFMPKPIYGEAGNGMHVHMHLFRDGKPLFYDPKGYSQLSDLALHFIGGLLTHASALCAFTNPSTNSYKRLVPGYESPVTIGYATSNRSSVIRIPDYAKSPEQRRFELRSPDGTCNPYYAYAAILLAGLDGVQRKIDPEKAGFGPYDFNLYNLTEEEQARIRQLPRTLDQALDALEEDHDFLTAGGVFPQRLIDIWLRAKRAEAKRHNLMPHPVEFETCYDL